nr:MAG TPA: hypothetical protein [Caudoviricetes sp.]
MIRDVQSILDFLNFLFITFPPYIYIIAYY